MAHSDPVLSLLKGLDILRTVGEAEDGLRLNELAAALGLKTPATHHLVRTLILRQFLEKGPDGRLRLGTAVSVLGEQQLRSPRNAAVEGAMLTLQAELPGATVIWGVRVGAEFRQTRRLSPDRPGVVQRLSGDALHPYASAAGLIALAHADAAERSVLEDRRPFAEHGLSLWKTREKLDAFLALVAKEGAAESPFDDALYLRQAVAILDGNGQMVSALGASLPRADIKGKHTPALTTKILKEAAARLGKASSVTKASHPPP